MKTIFSLDFSIKCVYSRKSREKEHYKTILFEYFNNQNKRFFFLCTKIFIYNEVNFPKILLS